MSETPTAYSVEEHMFNQDEIQKRHPQPDQQRSEAAGPARYVPLDYHNRPLDYHNRQIAERDATIAALRAANERLVAGQSTWYRTAEAQDKQIARLEAEIAELKGKQ